MKTCSSIIIFFIILFLFSPGIVHAKIWINEFSSNGSSDWIELYNDEEDTVPLNQFRIRDNTNSNKLDLSGDLGPKGYGVFEWGSKLNNSGDTIRLVLISDENTIIDKVQYAANADVPIPGSGQFAGKQSDGGTPWVIFTSDTKGATNIGAPIAPAPTPLPQNTPIPVRQPTPTRVPTPTRTPTPIKPSPTPKVSLTPTPPTTPKVTPKVSPKISPAVLGSSTKSSPVPTSVFDVDMGGELVTSAPIGIAGSQEVIVKNAQTSPLVLTIVGGLFMVACGILMVFRKRIWKKLA